VGVSEILAQIDREIVRLQKARASLVRGEAPASNAYAAASAANKPGVKKKRNLSPEGRKHIAESVKRRGAAKKKASAAK
jgi:hypothetical protein